MSILAQLRAWRGRWRIDRPEEEEGHRLLCRSFAVTFSSPDGKVVYDYLIEQYFRPLEFIGAVDLGKLAERNGQQIMLIDIMQKVDEGQHPWKFEPERGSQDDAPVDVRI